VWLDGKPLAPETTLEHEPGANIGGGTRIDGYHTEIYVAEDHLLAWRKLAKGTHSLSFRCVGKNNLSSGYGLGVDTIVLARIGALPDGGRSDAAELRRVGERGSASPEQLRPALADRRQPVREAAAWVFTQQPELAARSIPALKAALADTDPVVRGLAAVAMRNCGLCAEPALPELIARIKDSDPNVRIAAADALTRLGEKAAPALDVLIEVAQDPGQHAHVLRSVAAALAGIGPAAAPAVPALERLRQHIRVRWIAESAIAKIRKQPLPTGPEPGGVKLY
jgi:hypothetical protein